MFNSPYVNSQSAIHKDLPAETLIYSISGLGLMGRKGTRGAGCGARKKRPEVRIITRLLQAEQA